MKHVLSSDGTPIAYERSGEGPAVILVGGLVDRTENMPLAQALAEHFTVYIYDQRGRGHSGDTQPYNVRREIEDLGAVIALAGGSAHVYGASAGGALGLEAAAAGLPIDRLAVYEVSYGITDGPEQWRQYISTLEGLIADGRRGDAFALFMRTAERRSATSSRPAGRRHGRVLRPWRIRSSTVRRAWETASRPANAWRRSPARRWF
jgi:pimeloyl-ACP methyl ester carboxylesterase